MDLATVIPILVLTAKHVRRTVPASLQMRRTVWFAVRFVDHVQTLAAMVFLIKRARRFVSRSQNLETEALVHHQVVLPHQIPQTVLHLFLQSPVTATAITIAAIVRSATRQESANLIQLVLKNGSHTSLITMKSGPSIAKQGARAQVAQARACGGQAYLPP